MDNDIIDNAYKGTDLKTGKLKHINYVECPIHGRQMATKRRGMCDKCYNREQYLKYKSMKINSYCMIHGLRVINHNGECRECVKQKKVMEEFFNK